MNNSNNQMNEQKSNSRVKSYINSLINFRKTKSVFTKCDSPITQSILSSNSSTRYILPTMLLTIMHTQQLKHKTLIAKNATGYHLAIGIDLLSKIYEIYQRKIELNENYDEMTLMSIISMVYMALSMNIDVITQCSNVTNTTTICMNISEQINKKLQKILTYAKTTKSKQITKKYDKNDLYFYHFKKNIGEDTLRSTNRMDDKILETHTEETAGS